MNIFQLFPFVLVLCLNSNWAFGQNLPYILTSPYATVLEEREIQIYKSLKSYSDNLPDRNPLIDKYLEDYEECQKSNYSAAQNPIKATRMVRRFPKYIEPIKKHLKDGNLEKELYANLHEFSSNSSYLFPGKHDYLEMLESILELQYLFDLKPIELIDGVIQGIQTGVGLTPEQSLEMARYAVQRRYFTLAYHWLCALKEKNLTEMVDQLEKRLFSQHDKLFEEQTPYKRRYLFVSKISNTSKENFPISIRQQMLLKWGKDRKLETELVKHFTYVSLCNGHSSQTPKEAKRLKCFLSKGNIFPTKVEQLSVEPELLLYHHFISDGWIEKMKKTAWPGVLKKNLNRLVTDMFYTLDLSWLPDKNISATVPILEKIEGAAGIRARSNDPSENIKIGLYGSSGQFKLHKDVTPHFRAQGFQKTFQIYMTDVDVGGATIFPKLGVTVSPEKGMAIYWSNFDKDGNPDERMVHAACPIPLGQKWITAKWIGIWGNGHGLKCDADRSKK